MIKKYSLVLVAIFCFVLSGFGQTTVTYDFSDSGAQTGVGSSVALDANISFQSFKNGGTVNPVINSGQLRLYQNATKGGSIIITPSNGVTIINVVVYASGTTGDAGYTVDSGAATNLNANTTYTMSSISAISEVEFYQRESGSGNRIYVDSFEVTYNSIPTGPTVTYDGNGNTSGSAPTDTISPYNSGDTVTVLGEGSLTNSCGTFSNWHTTADGVSGTSYSAGNTFTITASVTLYAQWTTTTNTVTFNSNGGTGTMTPQMDCTSSNLTNNTFTYTSFTFNSWNTAADGSGTTYADGATYSFSANMTLYAQWDVYVGPCLSTGFESGEPSDWANYDSYYNGGTAYSGSQKAGMNDATDWIRTDVLSNPSTLTFWSRASGSGSNFSVIVQHSENPGGPWINTTTISANGSNSGSVTDAYSQTSVALNLSGNHYIRWFMSARSGGSFYLDDVEVFCGPAVPGPEMNLTQGATSYATTTVAAGSDTYDFGNHETGTNTDIQFTIENIGSLDLTLSPPTISGIGFSLETGLSLTTVPGPSGTSTFTVRFSPTNVLPYSGTISIANNDANEDPYVINIIGNGTNSNESDIIAVPGSESTTISSTINHTAPLTVAQGVQVWQIRVRDGGATLNDTDNLPTILTALTLAQNVGNSVTTWSDAIETIALFDGATFVSTGTVTANQIQFSGLNVSVTDNTEKTLSLRLSLKCPLGPDAFDNEDFVFSLSNANTTFSSAGSGKATFSAQTATNGENKIAILATQLAFTTQPTTTGINSPMSNVVVTAVDTCGNKDTDFTGTVTLTSLGTMTDSPLTANAIAGEATFTNIVHTNFGSNFTMNASGTGLTLDTSTLFDILNITTFAKGDLAIVAVNTNTGTGSPDQISFISFIDILPGTQFYLTDNGYERLYPGKWGGTEGVISITRTGSTLDKGTIIVIESTNGNITSPSHFDVYTCGGLDTNWTKTAISGGGIGGFNLNSDDDVWIMQSGTWINDTGHNSTYDGNVLYGWTESGWNTSPGNGICTNNSDATDCTRWSTIYPGLECFNTVAPTGAGKVKFDDPVDPDFSIITNGRLDWIALINNPANWITYSNNTAYNTGGYDYKNSVACPAMTIATPSYINGKWVGRVDENWFNCLNWDNLKVPDETVDVQVGDNTFDNHANIEATAPFASSFGSIAKTRNLTITGEKVEISSSLSNKLEVHGDLLIDVSGALDMDDGDTSTADGELSLYGNWTNTIGTTAFDEGNGTVIITGNTTQTVNVITPLPPPTNPTEEFYNVILNNDFSTSMSNDLFLNGNLTVNAGKTVVVAPDDYIHVHSSLTNNGTFNIENSGSLVQVNETDTNSGSISMKRTTNIRRLDYVYWSSPVVGFNIDNVYTTETPTNRIYRWNTTITNPLGGQGNWVPANGEIMAAGIGYIVRGPDSFTTTAQNRTATFNTGKPHNGLIPVTVSRGEDYLNEDDNWNLIGNPYPSAIDAFLFLNHSSNNALDGFVNIWTHGNLPIYATNPFYDNFGSNYTAADYITYNGLGSSAGIGDTFITAGQSFMVNMLDGTNTTDDSDNGPVVFSNTMRNKAYDNFEFYRTTENHSNEKHRIWLDFVSEGQPTGRILIGYTEEATIGRDRLYDAITDNQAFYSLIDNKNFAIQGRGLPFSEFDVIPLGINIASQGNHYIAIAEIDGLFETDNQTIYLKDNVFGITHNLTQQPYSFASDEGVHNHRFELVFRDSALSVDDYILGNNGLTILERSNDNVQFTLNSSNLTIKDVEIIDLLGRTVYKFKGSSNTETYNLSNLSSSAYMARVTLSNNQVIVKKAIKK